uniref:DNA-directed RNA polymerase RpoA/D/Rpb3-type domain-containing protein n=1 Tax=viral metagenome TaxID=1070528 RepID=A0A6C0LYE4_9ZZZZ
MDIFTNFENQETSFVSNKDGNNFKHETSFILNHIPLSLANSFRRAMLSNIPIVSFSDEWVDNELSRSIVIEKNSSGIHNEFLSHRISLVPLYMGEDLLKVKTQYNVDYGKRIFDFKNPTDIPHFKINIKNNKETRDSLTLTNSNSNITVTNNDFQYSDSSLLSASMEDISPKVDKIFLPDFYTGEFINLNILKPNVLDDEMGEEISLVAKPSIGIGKQHARYCPVGTVSFQLQLNDEELIEEIFRKKLDYTNKERRNRKLKDLSEDEEEKFRRSFNLLDKDRIFKTNGFGNPNSFIFNIESIGFLESDEIVYDALTILELKILDILNSLSIEENSESLFQINHLNNKISTSKSNDLLNGYIIDIDNENHTIGNIISEYFKASYIGNYALNSNILSFASYSMPHPLKETIKIKIKLNKMDITTLNELNQYIYKKWSNSVSTKNIEENDILEKNIYEFLLINCLKTIYNDICHVKNEFSHKSHITKNSFRIDDEAEFFNVFPNFPIVFPELDGFHKKTNILQSNRKEEVNEIIALDDSSDKNVFVDEGENESKEKINYLEDIKSLYDDDILKHLKKTGSEWSIKTLSDGENTLSRIREYIDDMVDIDVIVQEILEDKVKIRRSDNNKEYIIDITNFLRDFKPKEGKPTDGKTKVKKKITLKKKEKPSSVSTTSVTSEEMLKSSTQ